MPALKGLAETCLSLAESRFQQQLLGCARDNAQLGIDMITMYVRGFYLFAGFYSNFLILAH